MAYRQYPARGLQTFWQGSNKDPILLYVALLHQPAPGHGRTTETPVLSGPNHIFNLPRINQSIELQRAFLRWVGRLCTWSGNTCETKPASEG